jgi:hypothetical protein
MSFAGTNRTTGRYGLRIYFLRSFDSGALRSKSKWRRNKLTRQAPYRGIQFLSLAAPSLVVMLNPTKETFFMLRPIANGLIALVICSGASSIDAPAQAPQAQKSPSQDPSTYMHVDAPLAQSILVKVKAGHDDIVKLGLHAVPPGTTDNVIIANITTSKIGKKSSAKDLANLAQNKPIAARLDKDKTFDLLIPITDSKGRDIDGGFIVMEVPYSKASSEEEAITIGVGIRDEVQRQILSKSALYQH